MHFVERLLEVGRRIERASNQPRDEEPDLLVGERLQLLDRVDLGDLGEQLVEAELLLGQADDAADLRVRVVADQAQHRGGALLQLGEAVDGSPATVTCSSRKPSGSPSVSCDRIVHSSGLRSFRSVSSASSVEALDLVEERGQLIEPVEVAIEQRDRPIFDLLVAGHDLVDERPGTS